MDLIKQLEQKDIINIAKLAMISKIFNKEVEQLITEIDQHRGQELSEKVKKYFIEENINKSLPNHNKALNILLDEKRCYINTLNLNQSSVIESGQASIYYDNTEAIKMFPNSSSQLVVEWLVYSYIIPFLYYSNMTFNILIPKVTGKCQVHELSANINFTRYVNNRNLDEEVLYVNTPFIKNSLYDVMFTRDNDIHYYIFQLFYTMASFAKVGLIHNDLHAKNIMVSRQQQRVVKFVIDDETSFDVSIENVPMIFDFDFAGIDDPIKGLMEKFNMQTEQFRDPTLSRELSLTYTNDGGRRDMLLFLTRYAFSYYDQYNYIDSNPTFSENATNHINGLFNTNIRNSVDFVRVIREIKRSEDFAKIYKNYEELINLLIFITNGKVKIFFQSIKSKKYNPGNGQWEQDYIRRNGKNPSREDWIFDLIYRNNIPECPLKIPYNDEICMSPLKLLKTDYFQNFVNKSDKINKNFGLPEQQVSINVKDDLLYSEYSRFMKEFFNISDDN